VAHWSAEGGKKGNNVNRPLLRRRANPRRLPPYTVLRCFMTGHQVSWCRGLCKPLDGYGLCGRLAPHAMVGKTQRAIADYAARMAAVPPRAPAQPEPPG
jgi:hypothetical protein